MRAHTLTQREMTTGQRQMRVSDLAAQHHGPEAIAAQLGVQVDIIRDDLAAMDIDDGQGPARRRPSPGPASCGTERGYQAHKTRKESACADCTLAHNRDQKARSIRAGRQGRMTVTPMALAELYLHAPEAQRERLADELGIEVCEALVDYHHQIERATGRFA
ncbi:helix-turn-helix DNA binding protein [Gordonia phage Doggs]|nr:helix-turn-helix DNA binding protein [Gordonia phage Doggs]